MLTALAKLYRTGLLTPRGLYQLLRAVMATGPNPMALLRAAARLHPARTAVVDDRERLTYPALYQQAEALAAALAADYHVRPRQKVAVACRNHAVAVKAVFAASRLGAHVYLVNPEMSADQLRALEDRQRFDFYVYDEPLAAAFADPALRRKSLPAYHDTEASVDRLASQPRAPAARLGRVKSGNIVVMTGGTTGQPKAASRKPSVLDFLPPFAALLTQVNLDRYRTVYVATPLYHGFGLAALFVGVALGAEIYLTRRFDAAAACDLIARHKVEAVALVPLMLRRMLARDADALRSLRCVISGGAVLDPPLARQALADLGPALFNLYGTSEGGFCIMATPDGLARKPESIGRPIRGALARIVDAAGRPVAAGRTGRLRVRSAWTTDKSAWIETGDLATRDRDGDLFLCGRIDDMIVSGGENVYPVELENVLGRHPDVAATAAVGIPDAEFGQRLKAVVVMKPGRAADRAALLDWLKPRVARHQMPAAVEFRDELPHTPLGKVDKKALRG